jgi:hypothetical protein
MYAVGFLKEHDENVACSKDLNELLSDTGIDDIRLAKVMAYLDLGLPLVKFMGDFYDTDGSIICRCMYLTDGEWIWPNYYVHYLRKYPNMMVPKEFIEHIELKESVRNLPQDEKIYAELMILKLIGVRIPREGLPAIRKIKHLIDANGEAVTCC